MFFFVSFFEVLEQYKCTVFNISIALIYHLWVFLEILHFVFGNTNPQLCG